MKLQKESVFVGAIGLLAGMLIAGAAVVVSVNNDNRSMMRMMGMDMSRIRDSKSGHMGMSMNDMSYDLDDRSGSDFDENFISMMIAHHQGAINMAKLAENRAEHDEVKQLGKDIISAQTDEIEQMRAWQQDWGYSDDDSYKSMHMMR